MRSKRRFSAAGQGENIQIISSHFGPNLTNSTAILPVAGEKAGQIFLSNVSATSDTKMLVDKVLPLPAGGNSRTWFLSGQVYESGQPSRSLDPMKPGYLPAPPAVATNIPLRQRPTWSAAGVTAPVNVRTCCGAKGDGVTDDTKALQQAIDTHASVFIPYGTYVLSDTVTLKPDTALIGEGMAFLMLQDGAPGFGDVKHPKPMLLAPSDADAETVLVDLALSTEAGKANANLGAVLLSWGAGPLSSTYDLHVQLFAPVHTAIHITGHGGGVVSNTWGWGADHNLTTNVYLGPTLSAKTNWLGALSGLRVDSEGPTWLLGTQFEHHREIMYNLTGAKQVTLLQSQTENPYWRQGLVGSPACEAHAMVIKDSENITFHGTVWCSWFCALTDGISKTLGGNTNVNAYGVWSNGEKAGTPIVQGAKPLVAKNGGKFLADLNM